MRTYDQRIYDLALAFLDGIQEQDDTLPGKLAEKIQETIEAFLKEHGCFIV